MSRTLILSATITPPTGVALLLRSDPALRLRDYLKAFEFYLKLPDHLLPRIVFADNSNSDVSPLRDLARRFGGGKEVHVLSFDGLDHPAGYGRGYGEMKLMDRVIDTFEPVAQLPPDSIIWKGTGRYILSNFAEMIRSSPEPFELYCDLKNRPFSWLDMRFFAFSIAAYRRIFLGRYRDLREDLMGGTDQPGSSVPEIELRKVVDAHLDDPGVFPRFKVEPFVEGRRSYDNQSYVRGKNLAKYWIRKSTRVFAPQFWL